LPGIGVVFLGETAPILLFTRIKVVIYLYSYFSNMALTAAVKKMIRFLGFHQ
jgi:hypothetical protein